MRALTSAVHRAERAYKSIRRLTSSERLRDVLMESMGLKKGKQGISVDEQMSGRVDAW